MLRHCLLALCVTLSLPLHSCAYRFQGSHNPLKELGIQKIYVEGFRNKTFRPGIEHLFTTAMVREIGRSNAFRLVNTEREADAVLSGTVLSADSSPGSTKSFQVGTRSVDIATEYGAGVSCSIELRDRSTRVIFAQVVNGTKVHPGAAGKDDPGATAPLVNDSEQRLAIQFLATQMMASVYQRMIDTF